MRKYQNESKPGFLTVNGVKFLPKSKNMLYKHIFYGGGFGRATAAVQDYKNQPTANLNEDTHEVYLNTEWIYTYTASTKEMITSRKFLEGILGDRTDESIEIIKKNHSKNNTKLKII